MNMMKLKISFFIEYIPFDQVIFFFTFNEMHKFRYIQGVKKRVRNFKRM